MLQRWYVALCFKYWLTTFHIASAGILDPNHPIPAKKVQKIKWICSIFFFASKSSKISSLDLFCCTKSPSLKFWSSPSRKAGYGFGIRRFFLQVQQAKYEIIWILRCRFLVQTIILHCIVLQQKKTAVSGKPMLLHQTPSMQSSWRASAVNYALLLMPTSSSRTQQ